MRQGKVAFFDSGIGGLTVLAECRKLLPNVSFYYYGDNAHAPYGNLSKEEMRPHVLRAFDAFARMRVNVAVIACNTVTALFAEELRARYSFQIIGAEPAIRVGAKLGGEIFVLTTRATYESSRFRALCDAVAKEYPQSKIMPFACDGLAGEIERHVGENGYEYAPLLPKGSPSAVVLGCTHYIYAEKYIREYYHCTIFHGNRGIAERLSDVIMQINAEKKGILSTLDDCMIKNRDAQPPRPNYRQFSYLKGGVCIGKTQKRYKTNKCSHFNFKKARKYKGKMHFSNVYFIGESGKKNLKIYKQMFAYE